MAFVRCKPCTYLRIGSKKSFIRTTSHGIGGHFWGRVDPKHTQFSVQFQFEHTTVHKSIGAHSNYADIFDESIENNATRCEVLAAPDFGEFRHFSVTKYSLIRDD